MKPSLHEYRADIDGLRAIAVVAVILVHAGTFLSGGFLGVDIFFVISGYLIHRDLKTRFETKAFSAREFYGRRMRRTLPALYCLIFVCLVAAGFILMPGDFDAFARSAAAASLAVSNILFLLQSGYFDHQAITKPLLHTWSLGVEEQFYLVAPFISYGLSRIPPLTRRFALVFLIALCLAICVLVQRASSPAAFFLMPTRLWEFLIGCAIAEGIVPQIRHRGLAEIITASALLAMLGAMALFTQATAHPGLLTLIPCVAAAAIIHVGGSARSMVGSLLGTRPFVFVGLISYSLYLWHWPLLVFVDYLDQPLTPGLQVALGACLIAISILSWRLIERPFRDPSSPLRRKALILWPQGLAVVLGASACVILARGLPQRFSADVAKVSSYYDYEGRREFREGTCFLTTKFGNIDHFNKDICLKQSTTKPNYLLIGDSHAAQYWIGLSKIFPNVNFLQATASGCKPILDTGGQPYCTDLMKYALRDFLPSTKLDGVIFAAAWMGDDISKLGPTIAQSKKFARKVIVFGRIPSYEMSLPNLLGRSLAANRPELVLQNQINYPLVLDPLFDQYRPDISYVSIFQLLCPDRKCRVYASDNVPLQFDTSHLTTEGSIVVANLLEQTGLFAMPSNSSSAEIEDPSSRRN